MSNSIDVRITKARSALVMQHAFFGSLAMRLQVRARGDIQTMATDGTHLFYRPAFLDTVTETDVIRIVAHEVLHCALGHTTRRNGRNPERWNIACDHVVNLMLQKAGFVVPPDRYCDQRFDGFNAEEIFRILEAEEQKQQSQQQKPDEDQRGEDGDDDANGQGGGGGDDAPQDQNEGDDDAGGDDEAEADGDGEDSGDDDAQGENDDADGDDRSGNGSGDDPQGNEDNDADPEPGEGEGQSDSAKLPAAHGDPGGDGEVLDAAPQHDKAANAEVADEWEVFTRQAVNIARKQGEGKVPGFLEQLVDDLATPRTNWRDVLRRFVDPCTTKDYSWVNPNRRFMSMGYYTPGAVSDGVNHVALLIDTSGSVDIEWLRRFGGEAQAALDDGAIDKVTVVFADTRVNRAAEYVRGDQIDFTVQGRGGTSFAPTFAWLNDNALDLTAAIYFTDLDCTEFGETPAYPVLWAAYGDPRDLQRLIPRVPFGEVVELTD